ECQPLPVSENFERLIEALALGHKILGRRGVELEKVKMARDDQSCLCIMGQPSGLGAIQVSGYPAFRVIPINGQQGQINGEGLEGRKKAGVQEGISAVIKGQA